MQHSFYVTSLTKSLQGKEYLILNLIYYYMILDSIYLPWMN